MHDRCEESGSFRPLDERRGRLRRPVGAERFEADRIQNALGARPASPDASDATQSPSRRERGETAYS
jgi:hypothetical protein